MCLSLHNNRCNLQAVHLVEKYLEHDTGYVVTKQKVDGLQAPAVTLCLKQGTTSNYNILFM